MNDALQRSLAIFGLTGVAAFGVNAAGHAWMLWRGNPLVRQHRATLAYRSALIGDSLLLPLVNVLLDRQLDAWGDGLRPGALRWGRLARALLVGTGLTALLHGYQGAQKLTNWTMPRPGAGTRSAFTTPSTWPASAPCWPTSAARPARACATKARARW
jgi:hypothetical protein